MCRLGTSPGCESGRFKTTIWVILNFVYPQTPSTGLRHPSFEGRCRKAVLGVWSTPKLQALVYDILPLKEGAGKRCSECGLPLNSKHWFTTSFLWRMVPESDTRSVVYPFSILVTVLLRFARMCICVGGRVGVGMCAGVVCGEELTR